MALSSDSAFVQVNVRYRIEGLKQAATDSKKAATELSGFGKILKQVGLSLLAFKAVDFFSRSLRSMGSSLIDTNAKFEKFEIQLKIFSGSGQKAAQLMNFLTFQSTRLAGGLEDLLGGATALQTFGIDVQQNLELVADVAQATNRAVEDVAIAFGRIVAGDPRTKQFLVTRRGDIEEFNRALAEGKTRLEATQIAFQRFSGVSQELEGSWSRLVENFEDLLFVGAKIVGEGIFEQTKDALQGIVDALRSEVFDESGKQKTEGFFVDVGKAIETNVKALGDFYTQLVAIKNLFDILVVGPFAGEELQKQANEFRDAFAPTLRALIGVSAEGAQDQSFLGRTRTSIFALMGLTEFGETPDEFQADVKKQGEDFKQSMRDIEREIATGNKFRIDQLRAAQEAAKKATMKGSRDVLLSQGISLGPKATAVDAVKKQLEQIIKLRKESADEPIEPVDPLFDPDFNASRLKIESDFLRKRLELRDKVRSILEEHEKESIEKMKKREEELFEFRFQLASRLTDRAVGDLGFVLFGGRESNARIDEQIARIQQEVDVLDGVTAPLTRQEELMNRIVELESQRVSINERLGQIVRRTLGDLAQTVAKAALLRAFGFGTQARGQTGGFGALLRFGLGLVPGIGQALNASGAGGGGPSIGPINLGGASEDIPGNIFRGGGMAGNGGAPGIRLNKPVLVNNPIFLSNDVRNVAEKFAVEAERRMR